MMWAVSADERSVSAAVGCGDGYGGGAATGTAAVRRRVRRWCGAARLRWRRRGARELRARRIIQNPGFMSEKARFSALESKSYSSPSFRLKGRPSFSPTPSPGSGNRSCNARPSIHERKSGRKSFVYCTDFDTRTNRRRKTAHAMQVQGRFALKPLLNERPGQPESFV